MSFLSSHPIACESPVRNFSTIKTEATIFSLLYILEHNNILALSQTWSGFGVIKKTIEFQSFRGLTYNFKVMIRFTVENAVKQS